MKDRRNIRVLYVGPINYVELPVTRFRVETSFVVGENGQIYTYGARPYAGALPFVPYTIALRPLTLRRLSIEELETVLSQLEALAPSP